MMEQQLAVMSNGETFLQDFLEKGSFLDNVEEIFSRYWIHGDVYSNHKSTPMLYCFILYD